MSREMKVIYIKKKKIAVNVLMLVRFYIFNIKLVGVFFCIVN